MAKKRPGKKKQESPPAVVRVDEQCPDTYWIALDGEDEIPITVRVLPEEEEWLAEKLAQWLWKYRHLRFEQPDKGNT